MVICYFGSGLQERDWLHRYRVTLLHGCMVTWLTLLHGAADWKAGARFERIILAFL